MPILESLEPPTTFAGKSSGPKSPMTSVPTSPMDLLKNPFLLPAHLLALNPNLYAAQLAQLQAAQLLGRDTANDKREDAGAILADVMRGIMDTMKIENGLSALGYGSEDLSALVEGALPQDRVNKLSPRYPLRDDLESIYTEAMTVY